MSAKISTMSAGRAGSSKYNVNVNGNQGGGNKLQGLAPTTNKRVTFVLNAIKRRAYSNPVQRAKVFCINQLGGIGARSKMFATGADGVNKRACLQGSVIGILNDLYQLLLNRNADKSGLKTYGAILSGNFPNTEYTAFVNYHVSQGFPPLEARIYLVFWLVEESPESQAAGGSAAVDEKKIREFFATHIPFLLPLLD
tara:strand:- start:1077 stop:1667 length:591 start_codon:yes stop_codon:yes gene_type:complete